MTTSPPRRQRSGLLTGPQRIPVPKNQKLTASSTMTTNNSTVRWEDYGRQPPLQEPPPHPQDDVSKESEEMSPETKQQRRQLKRDLGLPESPQSHEGSFQRPQTREEFSMTHSYYSKPKPLKH